MIDLNSMKYIGWNIENGNECAETFFTQQVVSFISRKISQNLEGVDPAGRTIIIPDDRIVSVMNSIYSSHRPKTGDIFSRYTIPNSGAPIDMRQEMIDRTIETITDLVRTELEMIENNSKLTAWTTVLGDFNSQGLRSHSNIKISKKRANRMEFNMNY